MSSGKEKEEDRRREHITPSTEHTVRRRIGKEKDREIDESKKYIMKASGGLGPSSAGGGGGATRRRSVHFGACPATVIAPGEDAAATAGSSAATSKDNLDADDELDDDELEESSPGSSLLLPRAAAAAYLRRRSAPASAIRGAAAGLLLARSRPGEDEVHPVAAAAAASGSMSQTLKALDPELRRSLNKLSYTKLENPEGDLDVVRPKLLGRDDLELYRLKQMKKNTQEGRRGGTSSDGEGGCRRRETHTNDRVLLWAFP